MISSGEAPASTATPALSGTPVPRATYRLQFNHTFTFADATAIVPYLARLGVSHLYASPIFAAAPGSMHGYDVTDYSRLNPEIGTDEEFDTLVATLHDRDMRLIVDFVPNHMGIENGQNAWWQDVLEHGEWSPYADSFDIDWSPVKRELRGKVLLPFLGGQYGDVLEDGELKLAWRDGGLVIDYWDTPLPVAARSWPLVLREVGTRLDGDTPADEDDIDLLELESIANSAERLDADFIEPTPATREARRREALVLRHRLASLIERSTVVHDALAAAITAINGTPGHADSFDIIDQLLNLQSYRLAYWRVASEEINYRRFFAINTLAAIRQEKPEVFAESHALLLRLCAEGKIDGVRIDHPDGLWDPTAYFRDLQRGYVRAVGDQGLDDGAADQSVDAFHAAHGRWPLYVVAEKIIEHGEALPAEWAIAGTVGYEFAQATTALAVDSSARVAFDRTFSRFTGDRIRYSDLIYDMKQQQMRDAFASEINVLSNLLNRISERDRHSRDFTLNSLRQALRQVISGFTVYRTYITRDLDAVEERDRRYIDAAVAYARRRSPALDPSIFTFIENVLIEAPNAPRPIGNFAMKLQQLTGPVMAKALEDTAYYRFNRLVSLNEVGGSPGTFGISVDEFHRQNRNRQRTWRHGMLTSSTHDTKRSEDVRARISVLSEIPAEWQAAVNRWTRLNRKLMSLAEGALAPHRADVYVIYQTLVGTWPLEGLAAADRDAYRDRLVEYHLKVAREAARFTNWVNPDERYETALTDFIRGLFDPRRSAAFQQDFAAFLANIRDAGLHNALVQHVLKLTSPGVPDIYQGTERWDDSLVDPDNRRAVDFAALTKLLDAPPDLISGSLKVYVTQAILQLRAERPELFSGGEYVPLGVTGPQAERVVAFARRHGGDTVVVVAGRLLHGAGTSFTWEDTAVALPDGAAHMRDRLGDTVVKVESGSVADLFARWPVAVLTSWSREA